MADYLNEEQKAQFMNMLGANEPQQEPQNSTGDETSPVEDNPGAAPVDAAASAPEVPTAPQPNPGEDALKELGMESVEALAKQYKDMIAQTNQYKEMLSQLLAFQQALDNKEELEPSDPLNTVKKAVREEMAPIYDKLQQDAKNKLVQEAWGEDAKNMPGLTDMMPEITAFIQQHPELSVANDGLRRAYEGVRSSKYRTESEMLDDSKFVERMASNEKVKDAVIKEYLANAARNGDNVPNSIGEGGNVPLTGKKAAPNSMEQAKAGLAKMLGLK